MPDMLQSGAMWLHSMLEAHASRTVAYSRGEATLTVTALVGRTLMRIADGLGGTLVEWTDRDYLIRATSLSAIGEPERGDRIIDTKDSMETYEVRGVTGEKPWRRSDEYGEMLRIHCKKVAS